MTTPRTEPVGEPLGEPEGEPALVAYRVSRPLLPLVPAGATRPWMADIVNRHANRCLPLLMANQAGWLVLNTHSMFVVWTGGDDPASLKIVWRGGEPPYPAMSHFGHGILTWNIPYVFRTPPGFNLLVRGPSNSPKDGVHPLEGLVETDWSEAQFTMNWKLTRPNVPVAFSTGEPICMIVPQRRHDLETFHPQLRDLEAEPKLQHGFQVWQRARREFQAEARIPGSAAATQGWSRAYFDGVAVSGSQAPEHQTKLRLRGFRDTPTPATPETDSGTPGVAVQLPDGQ